MEDRQKLAQTELTAYAQQRREEEANKPKAEFQAIPYLGNFKADDTPYDPLDFKEVRKRILDNVEIAVKTRFPLENDKYLLTVDDVHYQDHNYGIKDEKVALRDGKSLTARLKGTWNLYDKATGKLIDTKTTTLLNVPYMTDKGTFIRNGSEYALKHMFRLRSGIYTRIKNDGNIATHINPEQGTGRQSTINMDPETGIFTVKMGTRNYGLLPLLKAMNTDPDAIEKAWGKELFETNFNKYRNIMTGADSKGAAEYNELWKEKYSKMKLDPETTGYTLGVPYKEVNSDVFLNATGKILKIAQTYDPSLTDARDSLLFQKVMGPADYVPEKIVRDGGGLARNLFNQINRTGNLSAVVPGIYQAHVDSVFLDDKHAAYVEGASPFESIDLNSTVSRLGEGGIGDLRAAPAESRHVQNSYLGFVDPIRSTESLAVGLNNYMSYGVKKDSNGNLYSMFIRNGETKPKYVKMTEAAKSVVATPEYFDPSADPEEFIPAFSRGNDLEYVKRKDVDYFLSTPNRMMSVGASTIPGIGGIRSNRTLMGCLHPETELTVWAKEETKDKVYTYIPKDLYAYELLEIQDLSNYYLPVLADKDDVEAGMRLEPIRGVHKTEKDSQVYVVRVDDKECKVNERHKWWVRDVHGTRLVTTAELKEGMHVPLTEHPVNLVDKPDWGIVEAIYAVWDTIDYFIDIDVDDNVYAVSCGIFTHNSKYPLQALPLQNREAPLVQRALTNDDGSETTTERFVAKQLGARFSPVDGKVISVDSDSINIRGVDGKKYTVDLYNEYPANQKGFINNFAQVKPGQRVKANQLLASSNYTTDDGQSALGTNLKVAFLNAPEGGTFEDGIYLSESAAKKLTSEQLYKTNISDDDDIDFDKNKFINLFKSDEFTPEQMAKLDDTGIVKVGTTLEYGDPMIIGVQNKPAGLHGIAKHATAPYIEKWEHHYPGIVTDVTAGGKKAAVYVKTYTPMKPGDKMCYDDKTEVYTQQGWKLFKDLKEDDKLLTLDTQTGDTYFEHYSRYYRFAHKGVLYKYESKYVSLRLTPEHNHLIAASPNGWFLSLAKIKDMKGKPFYHVIGTDLSNPASFAQADDEDVPYKECWVKYDGYVYCVEVPETHTVYTRRNGKCCWSGNSNRFGAKGIVSCYDSSTYVFTDKGFKPFPELTTDDRVAVLDTNSDPSDPKAHFEIPVAVQHYPYDGEMYGYADQNINWLVTPNHGMWCRKYHKCHKRHPENAYYARHEIQDIHGGRHQHIVAATFEDTGFKKTFVVPKTPRTGKCQVNDINEFDIRDFAAFLGLYLSEGHINLKDSKRSIIITQKEDPINDPESVSRCRSIEALLDRMGIKWFRNGIKYRFTHHDLCHYLKQFGYAKDKFIPEEVFTDWPDEAKEILLEYLYMGDGDTTQSGGQRYSTCSPRLKDDVQRLYILLGYRVTDVKQRDKCFKYGINHDALYRLNILKRTQAVSKYCADRVNYPGYYKQHYQGMVHCCTVSTGVILVKREGKILWCGNSIVPDEDMLKDSNGEPFDMIQSTLGIPSRINPVQMAELQLAKVAKHTGVPEVLPDFPKFNMREYTLNKLKENGLSDTETCYDPTTGMKINDVATGYMYNYKLKHMAESKKGARSTGDYTSEELPLKGGAEGARRFGSMEVGALIGHTGINSEVFKDAKLVKGQRNDEFWFDVRDGKQPDKPGIPLVHKKFFAHLQAAGVHLDDRGRKVGAFVATDADIRNLTKNRQVTAGSTYDSKDLRPIKGGLFDPSIFGDEGDQWGYYELPEPIINPLMVDSIKDILGWKSSEMQEVLEGARQVDGKVGTEAVMAALDKMDFDKELRHTKMLLKDKNTPVSKRSDLAKKFRALYSIDAQEKEPNDFFLTRIPILPPRFRPVSIIGNDVGIVADANFLYKKMIDAVEDFKEAREVLPEEELMDARKTLYNSIEAVVGLKDPADPKLQSKKVEGVLRWAFGKGSPKLGSLQRKIYGAAVDVGGRNAVSPDSSLSIDEVGISEENAWKMYEPFVVRKLRQRGYHTVKAVDMVLERDKEAFRALEECLEERPLLINRAPTLHKYSIMAARPRITKGNTLHVNPEICKNYGMDFDGDSGRNQVRIHIDLEKLNKNIEKTDFKGLTFLKSML